MTKCSVEAFLKGINNGKFNSQKHKIWKYLKRNPEYTIEDISFDSPGMKRSTITARISDLLDDGFIKVVGKFESKVSTTSKLMIVTDENESSKLRNQRLEEKKNRAIKVLLRYELNPETKEALIKETV